MVIGWEQNRRMANGDGITPTNPLLALSPIGRQTTTWWSMIIAYCCPIWIRGRNGLTSLAQNGSTLFASCLKKMAMPRRRRRKNLILWAPRSAWRARKPMANYRQMEMVICPIFATGLSNCNTRGQKRKNSAARTSMDHWRLSRRRIERNLTLGWWKRTPADTSIEPRWDKCYEAKMLWSKKCIKKTFWIILFFFCSWWRNSVMILNVSCWGNK